MQLQARLRFGVGGWGLGFGGLGFGVWGFGVGVLPVKLVLHLADVSADSGGALERAWEQLWCTAKEVHYNDAAALGWFDLFLREGIAALGNWWAAAAAAAAAAASIWSVQF
jgi:hypothetical protein